MAGGLDSRSRRELDRLADGGTVLRKELQKRLKGAGQDAARKAQARIRGASSKHPGTLRAELAASVTVRGIARRSGAATLVQSLGSRMPPGKGTLVGYSNAGARWKRWRHPVFGRIEEEWKSQTWPSAAGWFDKTLADQEPEITKQVRAAIDDTISELER